MVNPMRISSSSGLAPPLKKLSALEKILSVLSTTLDSVGTMAAVDDDDVPFLAAVASDVPVSLALLIRHGITVLVVRALMSFLCSGHFTG